jgi:hypothetical protein
MNIFAPVRYCLALVFALVAFATPLAAQDWGNTDQEGAGGAGAYVCPLDDAETGNLFCFRLGCTDDVPLRFEINIVGGDAPDALDVELSVDGRAAGLLGFSRAPAEDYISLTAPFDPRLHRGLVTRLREGIRAEVSLDYPDGAQTVEMSLRGSGRALGAVLASCPMPEVPLNDPASVVLDQIVTECAAIGGTVAMEQSFERREDLDGDGVEDVVIDYAAAVCSEMASLYCGSGGCTVGFFLARGDAYKRLFDGVIRNYAALPGGRLALDLHGTACGLYGFEACRKVFDITGDNFALLEELGGEAAEAAMAAQDAEAGTDEPAPAPVDEAAPEGMGSGSGSEPQAAPTEPDAPPPPADEARAPEAVNEPEPDRMPVPGSVWLGDDDAVILPGEGEALPTDLTADPTEPAPGENPDTGL